jgi:DNA-binding transcriptional MerR regulator
VSYLLAHEAARLLGELGIPLTPARVRVLEREGELPARRTSSGVRLFTEAEVRRFARRRLKARGDVAAR